MLLVVVVVIIGADINAQTDETQETALTLACCGGFLEVADFLIKAAADIELGCSTPLMEAAQEGHLELVKYLLKAGISDIIANLRSGDVDNAELWLLVRLNSKSILRTNIVTEWDFIIRITLKDVY